MIVLQSSEMHTLSVYAEGIRFNVAARDEVTSTNCMCEVSENDFMECKNYVT